MATLVSSTGDELFARVKEIAPTIREHAAEAEESRCVSRPVVEAMLKAGLFAMARPSAFGGLELDAVSSRRLLQRRMGREVVGPPRGRGPDAPTLTRKKRLPMKVGSSRAAHGSAAGPWSERSRS